MLAKVLLQHGFDLPLRNHQQVWVGGIAHGGGGKSQRNRPRTGVKLYGRCRASPPDERRRQTERIEHLQSAGLNDKGRRLPAGADSPFQDANVPARGVHLRSECKPGGTGPRDQYVDHGAARSLSLHHAPEESLELPS